MSTFVDSPSSPESEKIIEMNDVSKRFGSKSALDSVSFSVAPGSIFALLGENGAGKTTTIKILLGETPSTSGEARVFGLSSQKESVEIRRRVGFVPETPTLYEYMSVAEIGRFAAAFYPKGYWDEYVRLTRDFELNPNAKIKNLSKGMKAEVSLSLALANNPELLILDEPTSGLDALVRRKFLENMTDVAASGKTVFLSSHQMNEVERVADQVAFLKKSRLLLVEPLAQLKESTQILLTTIRGKNSDDARLKNLFAYLYENLVEYDDFGGRIRALGRRLAPDYESRLQEALGERFVAAEISRPNLDEIFVAYMGREEKEIG